VSVSNAPGHTKYLQTIFLNRHTQLIDCPGLVFPAADMPKALQVLSGLVNVAQLRDPYTAVQYLAERLPLESIYNLVDLRPPTSSSNHVLPTLASANMKDTEGGESSDCAPRRRRRKGRSKTSKAKFCGLGYDSDDQNQPSRMSHSNVSTSSLASNDAITSSGVDKSVVCSYSAWDICEHLAMKRRFKTRKGAWDAYRAANFILRDAISGAVILSFPPPAAGSVAS